MKDVSVAIVGAGLGGLYSAFLLEQAGIQDYVLLEARGTHGGRIVSAASPADASGASSGAIARFDLGPTWYWPAYQPQLDRLVQTLGLECFEQFESGDMVVERSPDEPPVRTRGYASSPPSMRLVGGMAALVDALRSRLKAQCFMPGEAVRRLRRTERGVALDSEAANGRVTTWHAGQVLLAMPPRLVADTLEVTPPLPEDLARQWRSTATWMAPHAKYVAVYDRPFWREQGLSGEARSTRGPLGEIHDASMPGGSAALFGFFGVPARVREGVGDEVLKMHCRAQFARLFGPEAATPRAEFIKDWSQDRWTATAADLDAAGHHGTAPAAAAASGPWAGVLAGVASEWSPQFPGYVAGAVEAAALAVRSMLENPMGATSMSTASAWLTAAACPPSNTPG